MTSELFGRKEYSAIYGNIMFGSNIGQALSALLMGGIYDAFGSYVPAWYPVAYTHLDVYKRQAKRP